jgi:hypothetical protein
MVMNISFKGSHSWYLLILLIAVLSGCGGGGGGSSSGSASPSTPVVASSNAFLSDLTLSDAESDQTFQSSQFSYTASVNFLTQSTTVTLATEDAKATVTVNNEAVVSGDASEPIALSEGLNTITVVVTAEDEITTNTYTIEVAVETAEDFAQQAFIKAEDAQARDLFGSPIALYDDTLAVTARGAVYVFERDGGTWIQQAHLMGPDTGEYTHPDHPYTWTINDQFGDSIALSGDTLVVGAPGDSSNNSGGESDNSAGNAGAVYVFVRTDGVWEQVDFLRGSNTEGGWDIVETDFGLFPVPTGDHFGSPIALSGGTLVVGALGEDSSATEAEADNSAPDTGAVYVFTHSNGSWSQEAILKAANAEANDGFGGVVAVSGNSVAVGSPFKDSIGYSEGAVYVFNRSNGVWSQNAFLKASNADALDYFGLAVAISEETLAVGAPGEDSSATGGEDDNSATSAGMLSSSPTAAAGAVYVFTRNGGTWTQQAYLKASNAGITDYPKDFSCGSFIPPEDIDIQFGDGFGSSVALSGDTLVVGAPYESSSATGGEADNSALFAGAVYVFRRTSETWNQGAFLKAYNADGSCTWSGSGIPDYGGDTFGRSVAIWQGSIAVGAPEEDSSAGGDETDNSEKDSGAVYIFQ